ncbi:helix-turn-helix domain-containing protein [Hydrogenophaga sp. OTU3427]|uniref:helix-turn-helix domain-containing protein n=1 Tax=Hydrogenophaga sp. OTU3427 TaxID=3043856 RepID=UPI00313D9051
MPRQSPPSSLFGRRLRAARNRAGIPQDKLGVIIGLDEGSSSARMSRYETGVHEPAFATALNLAEVLKVPVAYFYCDDDRLAEFLILYEGLDSERQSRVLDFAAELSAQAG